MNLKDLRKYKTNIRRGGLLYDVCTDNEVITFFDHPVTIVGVNIRKEEKDWKYWNNTKEVLLSAHYKGYVYELGLDKYKSERSLVLRINNFVKHIVNDTQGIEFSPFTTKYKLPNN